MKKTIDTLVPDIHNLFRAPHKVNEANLDNFMTNLRAIIKERLEVERKADDKPYLRMSKVGTPNRKLWYEMNSGTQEVVSPSNKIKFLYGDFIEQLLLFFVKEAGHTVSHEQEEVVLNGVVGHLDAVIDDVVTDVKSTSKYAFAKFAKNTLHQDDPFGYIAQISCYSEALKLPDAAFLAMNKETAEIALAKVDPIDKINAEERIDEIRSVISQPEPPVEKCYPDQPYGKSGNRVLHNNCGYCHFKDLCWKNANNGAGLRRFKYSTGVTEFTHVEDTPRVEEIFRTPVADIEELQEVE